MTATHYFITACIKAHIDVLGPSAALAVARKISSLTIADNGDVLSLTGAPGPVVEELKKAYILFAGETSRALLRVLTQKYPPLS
ncbi:MAG: hypothetical protein NUV61_01835 [Candidatus Azambacteria bacterium]|nr:hypothetical protein [Candidatus Azambacteria bacterium]